MPDDRIGRRRLLAAIGAGAAASTAGCARLDIPGGATTTEPSRSTTTRTETAVATPTPVPFDPDAAWPMLGAGPRHRGAIDGSIPGANPTRRWGVSLDGPSFAQPVIGNGRVHSTTTRRSVAIPVESGSVAWTADLGTRDTPALLGNRLYAGGGTLPGLIALDARNGAARWRADLGGPASSSPTVASGRLYVGVGETLFALDAATGENVWSRRSFGSFAAAPAVAEGVVYAHDGKTLFALDAATGSLEWELEARGLSTAPVVGDGRLLVGVSRSGVPAEVVAVSTDGREQWRTEVGSRLLASPAVADGTVLVGDAEGDTGRLRALEAASGSEQWWRSVGPVRGQPVTDGETVVVSSTGNPDGGSVFAFDLGGDRRWSLDIGAIRGGPAVADGHLFVPARGGDGERLLAFR